MSRILSNRFPRKMKKSLKKKGAEIKFSHHDGKKVVKSFAYSRRRGLVFLDVII